MLDAAKYTYDTSESNNRSTRTEFIHNDFSNVERGRFGSR